ncbi:TRAP transporter substrate-binding protein [Pukyongiella litopenaei]|uniref:TRAP transporter substrate-binding protein n=1 Tax=Pukyongiella litopenaei TaxID=2605946 RepID=A0A2S0MQL1_9RHOB|nr:TRAP transporter substrate-binding protein [Pukyongiella litopenaei]AVO38175.1 TRAP transporter substrate-binding protein [Pukyongiella litopenaei]
MTKFTLAGIAAGSLMLAGMTSAEEYRMGLITPPPHQWTVTAEALADEIREKTEDRVDILIFPSGQLGNEAQMLQQLQTGAMDFAFFTLGEFANRDPNYGIFLAPYIVDDVAGARALLKGETAQKLLDGMSEFGLVGLGWGMAGMRMIVTGDKVETVEGLAGKKIRTIPFEPELDFWKQVGAAPTPMPLPALYDAFANGQIDGMQIDVEGTWNSKYYEHARSIIISDHMMFPMAAIASGRKWATMSEEDRALVEETFATHIDELVGRYADIDADYRLKLEGTDVPVTEVGRAWFGSSIDDWYTAWRERAPMLEALEAEAENL